MSHDCHACNEYNQLSRRRFLAWSGAASAAAALAPAWLPRITFARDYISGRDVIVSIYLRGGCDGLSMCPPFGDPAYYTLRPTLAVLPPDATTNPAIDLNGYFGLPPAMAALLEPYQAGRLLVIHATGSTDSSRSHFDAQRYMEVGKPGDSTLFTGWLGRHLLTANPADPTAPVRSIGIGYQLQTQLLGGPKSLPVPDLNSYGMTGPSSTRPARLSYLNSIYSGVLDPVRSAALNTYNTVALLNSVGFATYAPAGGAVYGTSTLHKQLKSTAALIKADVGVEAVAIDKSGWDTHSAQGVFVGTMANNMTDLATGLLAFYRDVIAQGQNVTVVIMSEFGRRAAENASFGTDHGHGNVMFAMGNHIAGGRVLTQWPTLGSLYQNLDLQVTIDFRDILAEIVQNRLANLNLPAVFPGYTPTLRGVTL
jgi:uncharacterized protein (DUF1501 family)